MEGSDGERGARRTGVLVGVLGTLVVVLGIGLGVLLASGDDGGDGTRATAPPPATQPPATVTATQPLPTTATTPAAPTIDQAQAKAAAARGAAEEARRGGIDIPPSDWDVRCTAAGGGPRATRWTCHATSSSGQCAGTLAAYARTPGVGATTEPRIACGE